MSKLVTKDTLQAVAQTIYDNYVITADFEGDLMDSSDTKDVTNIIDPYYDLKTPLTFNILTSGNIVWIAGGSSGVQTVYYKKNYENWVSITSTTDGESIPVVSGDVLRFQNLSTPRTSYSVGDHSSFRVSDGCTLNVSGNIMSLIDGNNFKTLTTIVNTSQFAWLFGRCYGLIDASNLLLPALTLSDNAYYRLFNANSSLIAGPKLPATVLTESCYCGMFMDCTSLQYYNEELPATTLTTYCYRYMFSGCTSLLKGPTIKASTVLNTSCMEQMFYKCTNLSEITLHANGSGNIATNWVYLVKNTSGTFYKNPSATWTQSGAISSNKNGIPYGWAVVNINE